MADKTNSDSVARVFALSALQGTLTSAAITVTEDIGGYTEGTVIAAGTSLADILTKLLAGNTPVQQETIYYGATTAVPTSLSGLATKEESSLALVGNYAIKITAGDPTTLESQYPCFAVPNAYKVTKWSVEAFSIDLPHSVIEVSDYKLYYLNTPSYDYDEGGINYIITVEVAS